MSRNTKINYWVDTDNTELVNKILGSGYESAKLVNALLGYKLSR